MFGVTAKRVIHIYPKRIPASSSKFIGPASRVYGGNAGRIIVEKAVVRLSPPLMVVVAFRLAPLPWVLMLKMEGGRGGGDDQA